MKRTKEFWAQIEIDRMNGMSLDGICDKHNITRGIIKRARETGKLNDVRDRPSKMNWSAVQQSIDTVGVDKTLILFNTTMPSLYTAKQKGKIDWEHRRADKTYSLVFDKIDWDIVQQYYNDDHSTTDIKKKFNISFSNIAKATNQGLLILRNDNKKQELSLKKRIRTLGGSLKWSNAKKQQQSDNMKQVVLNNPESYSANNVCGRVKSYNMVDGHGTPTKVMGTWELLVAELLNKENIKWTNKIPGFPYQWEGGIPICIFLIFIYPKQIYTLKLRDTNAREMLPSGMISHIL